MPVPLSYLKKKEGVFVRPILSFALFALRHPFMYRSGVVFFSFLARYIFCRVHCWGGSQVSFYMDMGPASPLPTSGVSWAGFKTRWIQLKWILFFLALLRLPAHLSQAGPIRLLDASDQ